MEMSPSTPVVQSIMATPPTIPPSPTTTMPTTVVREAKLASLAPSVMPEATTTVVAPAEAHFKELAPSMQLVLSIIPPPPTKMMPTPVAREAKAAALVPKTTPTAGPM